MKTSNIIILTPKKKEKLAQVLIAICLFPSFLVHLNIPAINVQNWNLGLPIQGCVILVGLYLFQSEAKSAYLTNKKSWLLLALFYFWMWVSALASDYPSVTIKFAIKYTLHFGLFSLFLILTHPLINGAVTPFYRLILSFLALLAGVGFVEQIHPSFLLFEWLRPAKLVFNEYVPTIRGLSLLQNPNTFGALMVIGFFLTLGLYKQRYLSRNVFFLFILAFVANIAFSGSRNALLVLIMALIAIAWFKLLRNLHLGIVILITVVVFSLNAQSLNRMSQSIQSIPQDSITVTQHFQTQESVADPVPHRILIWGVAIKQFAQNPFTGVGPRGFAEGIFIDHPQISHGMNAHNLPLGILTELGLPGIVIFIGLLYSLLKGLTASEHLLSLPVMAVFSVQVVDYFIHSLAFMTVMLLVIALAANFKGKYYSDSSQTKESQDLTHDLLR